MTENEIAREVVDAAYRVHSALGPGLLESVYERVLSFELTKRGLRHVRQQAVPIVYEGEKFDDGFRADIVVGEK
jgi:GxxExxY protein